MEIDRHAVHIIAKKDGKIVGCVLGIVENDQGKIRQVLVIPEYKWKKLQELKVNKIYLHAR